MEKVTFASHLCLQKVADSFVTVQCIVQSPLKTVVVATSSVATRIDLLSALPGEIV